MQTIFIKNKRRDRRALALRTKLRRHSTAPRLCVSRSLKHISAQVVDDAQGRTVAHATTTSKALADQLRGKTKTEKAAIIGAEIAKKAKAAGVEKVVFDRGFTRYHGRVKALADAARTGGLVF